MSDKWREAGRELQSEGVKFECLDIDENKWKIFIYLFVGDIRNYRIAQQPIPDRPDWREWCRKLQNECGIKFDCKDYDGTWESGGAFLFTETKWYYRIAQQPIPKQISNYLQEEQMTEQKKEVIMMDGEPLEVGDPVYCLLRGEMTFDGKSGSKKYPLSFTDKDTGEQYDYTKDFVSRINPQRTIFWQKPEIIPPPKPKRKVKVWDWFVQWPNGDVNRMDMLTEQDARHGTVVVQKIDGTEREIEL